jgi:hypothetical protein
MARGNQLRSLLDVDKTHTAITGNRKLVMVAITRNSDAGLITGLNNRGSVLDLDLDIVNEHLHLCPEGWQGAETTAEAAKHMRVHTGTASHVCKHSLS